MNDAELSAVFHDVPLDLVQTAMRLHRCTLPEALRLIAPLAAKAEAEISARRLRSIQRSDMVIVSLRWRWLLTLRHG